MAESTLLIPGRRSDGSSGALIHVQPEQAGFEYLRTEVRSLAAGDIYESATGDNELCAVILGGACSVDSPEGRWEHIGARADIFSGMPFALYLPVETSFRIMAKTSCEIAFCYSRAEDRYPACLITPDDVDVEVRGGGNATRQINHILKPDFPAHRLMIVEVFTPGGNWSSYPPHKHDCHNPPAEVDLEEIYYYRIDSPAGYAVQRVYTPDRRIDETLCVRDGDLVLVPEGYHPVVAAHGYNVYYLNALAGSARSMAASDDPEHAWVRATWRQQDPRVPLVRKAVGA